MRTTIITFSEETLSTAGPGEARETDSTGPVVPITRIVGFPALT